MKFKILKATEKIIASHHLKHSFMKKMPHNSSTAPETKIKPDQSPWVHLDYNFVPVPSQLESRCQLLPSLR
jgi:hypothetical protein